MTRIIITVIAVAVAAGAFPAQAHQVVNQMAAWLGDITNTVTPGQQTALIILALLFVFVNIKSK